MLIIMTIRLEVTISGDESIKLVILFYVDL